MKPVRTGDARALGEALGLGYGLGKLLEGAVGQSAADLLLPAQREKAHGERVGRRTFDRLVVAEVRFLIRRPPCHENRRGAFHDHAARVIDPEGAADGV
jgi:hypothetical protein